MFFAWTPDSQHNYKARIGSNQMAPPPPHQTCRLSNLEKIRMRRNGHRIGQRIWINESLWANFQRQCYTLGHLDQVCIVTLDRRCEMILTGSDEGLIKIWSIKSGLLIRTLRGHSGEVMDMQARLSTLFLRTFSNFLFQFFSFLTFI